MTSRARRALARVGQWWHGLQPATRAALITLGQAAAAAVLVALVAFLNEVRQWMTNYDDTPDWRALLEAVGDASLVLAVGVVTLVHRRIKPPAESYPDSELDRPDRAA